MQLIDQERPALVEELAEKMHECSESKYEPKDRTPWAQLDEFYRKDWRDDADTAVMPIIDRLLAAADARDVFAASDSASWPPPTMKDAPFIRYLHKVMKPHQPTITPEECWVAIGAFRMWSSRNPEAAAADEQAAGEEGE